MKCSWWKYNVDALAAGKPETAIFACIEDGEEVVGHECKLLAPGRVQHPTLGVVDMNAAIFDREGMVEIDTSDKYRISDAGPFLDR